MRTVDSPFNADGEEIKPNVEISRPSSVAPADIADPTHSFDSFTDPEESYNWMKVRGTYLDGDFVYDQVDKSRNTLPRTADDIVKKYRYVKIVDLRTELEIYITEERFKKLFNTVLFKSN